MKKAISTFMALALVAGAALATSPRKPEEQVPTGKFLRAIEVRPILDATKGNWIAVREYNGQDLLYFTHLLSWRCGLFEIQFAVNGGEMQLFPMVPCNEAAPMTVPADATVYLEFPLGSIETIDVQLLYDDNGTDTVRFERANVMTP